MTQGCFTSEQVDDLLDKLSSDPQFREHFLGNPALLLAHNYGIKLDPDVIPAVRHLPTKEAIASNRDAIKSKLVGNAGLPMFLL